MKLSRNISIVGLILFNILIDQLSKYYIRANVVPGSKTDLLGDFFTLHNVENAGAFLGMGSELNPMLKNILLLILPVVVLGAVTFQLFKNKELDKLSLVGFASIIGGGIANIYDRIRFGQVTDFFHIDLGGVFRTGIFNVADMSVMFGLGCILYASFIAKNKIS